MATDPHTAALLILATIVDMSDRAESLGGARSISGVAALNTLQKSIQKNRKRIAEMCELKLSETA